MKAMNYSLISALLVSLSIAGTPASAKGVTTKITLTDLTAGTSIDITNPDLLRDFNVWAGPGTSSGGVEGTDGFIVDWRSGIAADPPSALRRYEVAFYSTSASAVERTEPEYVVFYAFDRSPRRGFVYLPGKTDKRYATNVRAIYRGNEGHWFRASDAWQRVVEPLALPAAAVAQQSSATITCLHGPNESAEQRDGRVAAVRVARMINSAEANGRSPYRALPMLNVPVPAGWEAHLTTDGTSYAFSVKDATDPCGFTLFSDERGLIYSGEALRENFREAR